MSPAFVSPDTLSAFVSAPTAFVGGLPGGMELAVLLLIFASFALVAVVVVAAGRALSWSGDADDQRVADLEACVADLESDLAALESELAALRRERDQDDP